MTTAAAPSFMPDAWHRASPRERAAIAAAVLVVAGALAWSFVWQPLTRDLERLREQAPRDAAMLVRARALSDDIAGMSREPAPARSELRSAVERALGDRGLRAPAVTIEAQDTRVKVVLPAVPFATLVASLDALRREAGAFVVESTITPRVEPGTVRAEFILAR